MNEQLVKLIDKLSYDGTLYSFGHLIYLLPQVQPHLEEPGSCAWLRRGVRQAGGHSRLPVRKKRAPCGALNSRSSCESTPMCLGPRHEISIVKETSRGKQ